VEPRVVPITPELVAPAAGAVARGFADNEIWVWMLGGEKRVRRALPRHYRAMIRHVYTSRGSAWTTPDTLGAALWYPPGTLEMSFSERFWEMASLMPHALTSIGRAARWEQLTHSHRPAENHWYLNTLAVDPEAQRGGVGTALIEPGLERADADGVGAYLETQRRANIPFYRRFGFEETGEIKLPDSPPLWLMWRPSRGRS
jgi:GNAT superfamily N-acetyltransferase